MLERPAIVVAADAAQGVGRVERWFYVAVTRDTSLARAASASFDCAPPVA